jgi:PTH1 family peptidyl-tRNA hydrolase
MPEPALIVGLGNPGSEYALTRHNIGFIVLDAFAAKHGATFTTDSRHRGAEAKTSLAGGTVRLLKPFTYMNESGKCCGPYSAFHKIPPERVIVVYDDITLAPGTVKLTVGGSAGGHNGIKSLLAHLPDSFARFRIGIGSKQFAERPLADHVLGRMTPEELTLHKEKLPNYLSGLETILLKGVVEAQNLTNRKTSP